MLDFTMDDSATLVRTLTYSIESDSVGLEPGNNEDFYDYNWNGKRDSTFINLIYDTSFVNVLWKGQYYRDTNNNPKRANPFVWDIERSPIRMSGLYFNYYGLQLHDQKCALNSEGLDVRVLFHQQKQYLLLPDNKRELFYRDIHSQDQ